MKFLVDKRFKLLFLIIFLTTFLPGCSLLGIGGVEYEIKDGEATLVSYSGRDSHFEIPSTYEGVPVTAIGPEAFRNATSLVSVVIPEGVTKIGHGAFLYCSNLESITIPDSVTIIEFAAFTYASSLKTIVIPEGVTSIEKFTFQDCISLESILLPSTLTMIKDDAFRNCPKLTEIIIPDNVVSIGSNAFTDCTSLDRITFSSHLETIAFYAFIRCHSLTTIDLPATLVEIGEGAFHEADLLEAIHVHPDNPIYASENGVLFNKEKTTLLLYPSGKKDTDYTFPDSVQRLNSFTINNPYIKTVYIPTSLISIESSAFFKCPNLEAIHVALNNLMFVSDNGVLFNKNQTTIHTYPRNKLDLTYTIPAGITAIPRELFQNNKNLVTVVIPEGVTSIGYHAFEGCTNLESITLPASLTLIEAYAFRDCTSLISIFIPIGVTTIQYRIFENCSALTIYAEASSKPSGWEVNWNMSNQPIVWGATR